MRCKNVGMIPFQIMRNGEANRWQMFARYNPAWILQSHSQDWFTLTPASQIVLFAHWWMTDVPHMLWGSLRFVLFIELCPLNFYLRFFLGSWGCLLEIHFISCILSSQQFHNVVRLKEKVTQVHPVSFRAASWKAHPLRWELMCLRPANKSMA